MVLRALDEGTMDRPVLPPSLVGENELLDLIDETIESIAALPSLITVEPPALVVGDLHGDYLSLLKALSAAGKLCGPECRVVFLGDYVDRGPHQHEVIVELMRLRVGNPDKYFLIRGNHETWSISFRYGFRRALARTYPNTWGTIYDRYLRMFAGLPYAALVGDYLGLHGGLPRDVSRLSDLMNLRKGLIEPVPDSNGAEYQILWNDPSDQIRGFIPGHRGPGSYLFGPDTTKSFIEGNSLKGIIRSHEPAPKGFAFYHGGLVLNVFTCRYYGYPTSVALVTEDGVKPFLLE